MDLQKETKEAATQLSDPFGLQKLLKSMCVLCIQLPHLTYEIKVHRFLQKNPVKHLPSWRGQLYSKMLDEI